MTAHEQQKINAPHKKYANAAGVYAGEFVETPAGFIEVPNAPDFTDMRFIDGAWRRPETKYYANGQGQYICGYCGWEPNADWIEVPEPPDHGLDTWDHIEQKWIDHPGKYALKREAEYSKVSIGQQLDAIYKFMQGAIQEDPGAPVDTPAGWLAWIATIKKNIPKPTNQEREKNVRSD